MQLLWYVQLSEQSLAFFTFLINRTVLRMDFLFVSIEVPAAIGPVPQLATLSPDVCPLALLPPSKATFIGQQVLLTGFLLFFQFHLMQLPVHKAWQSSAVFTLLLRFPANFGTLFFF